jgi:hypothetical protein
LKFGKLAGDSFSAFFSPPGVENGLATFFRLFSALQALKRQPCNPEMKK